MSPGLTGCYSIICADSVEAMRAALSQKVVELGAEEAATSSQLESAVCSLASLTGVPAATWTSSQPIVAFLEAAFAAPLKADSLAVTGLSTAEVSCCSSPILIAALCCIS